MLADLVFALRYAKQHRCSVAVVVPPEQHSAANTLLVALARAEKAPFGGRSMQTAGGCLLVMSIREPVLTTKFDVLFAGWGHLRVEGAEEMNRWRNAANQVVTRMG